MEIHTDGSNGSFVFSEEAKRAVVFCFIFLIFFVFLRISLVLLHKLVSFVSFLRKVKEIAKETKLKLSGS